MLLPCKVSRNVEFCLSKNCTLLEKTLQCVEKQPFIVARSTREKPTTDFVFGFSRDMVSVSAMLVYTRQKNIAQVFILERYFFVSIYPAAIPGTYLAMFLVAVLQLC